MKYKASIERNVGGIGSEGNGCVAEFSARGAVNIEVDRASEVAAQAIGFKLSTVKNEGVPYCFAFPSLGAHYAAQRVLFFGQAHDGKELFDFADQGFVLEGTA